MPTRTLYFNLDFADKQWAGRYHTLEAPEGDSGHGRPGEWLLGRHPAADLTFNLPTISARHAAIAYSYASSRWAITDLGSKNGTFADGGRLNQGDPVPLNIGARFCMASHCFYVVEDEQDTIHDDDDDQTAIIPPSPANAPSVVTPQNTSTKSYADVLAMTAEWIFAATTLSGMLYRLALAALAVAVVVVLLSGAL